jgi:hypothetical protein
VQRDCCREVLHGGARDGVLWSMYLLENEAATSVFI